MSDKHFKLRLTYEDDIQYGVVIDDKITWMLSFERAEEVVRAEVQRAAQVGNIVKVHIVKSIRQNGPYMPFYTHHIDRCLIPTCRGIRLTGTRVCAHHSIHDEIDNGF